MGGVVEKLFFTPQRFFSNPLRQRQAQKNCAQETGRPLNETLEKLDHKYLNEDVEFFKKNNPSAENIAKSNEQISQSMPDIIITDVKLSDGQGVDLCRSAREKSSVAFIFLADDSVKAEFEKELNSLGKAVLTKTHEVSEIVKLVENMI